MSPVRFAMAIDMRTCVGCSACVIACHTENDVADGCTRAWVVTETTGIFPELRMTIRSERCNHCDDAPCVRACPTGASHLGRGGVVLVNPDKCTGCKACIAACPYGARCLDPRSGTIDKCTFCLHRLEAGIATTACQEACPTSSIAFGDLGDPASAVAELLARRGHTVLQPEAGTEPMVFYLE